MSIASDVRETRAPSLRAEVDLLVEDGTITRHQARRVRAEIRRGDIGWWASLSEDWSDRDVVLSLAGDGEHCDAETDLCELLS